MTTRYKFQWGCMPSFTPDGLQLAIVESPPASTQLVLYNVRSGVAERRIQLGARRIWDISPDGRCLAIVCPTRQGETVVVWALETPRTAFHKLLLLRAAPKGTKLRVTTTDAASTGHLVLFRLVDKGNADVAAYALKFIL